MGRPFLGQIFAFELTGLPANQSYFINIGVSDTTWNGSPLPLPLGAIGLPSCFVLASGEITSGPFTYAGTELFWGAPIPTTMVPGSAFFCQAIILDPTTGSVLSTTNGGKGVVAPL